MTLHRQVEGDWITAIHPEDQADYQTFLETLKIENTPPSTEFRL